MLFSVFSTFSDLVAQRGERLELLIDKTENLVDSVSTGYDRIFQDVKYSKWLMANLKGKCLKFHTVVCFVLTYLCDYIMIMRITMRHRKRATTINSH